MNDEKPPDKGFILQVELPGEETKRIEVIPGGNTSALVFLGEWYPAGSHSSTPEQDAVVFQTWGMGDSRIIAACIYDFLASNRKVAGAFMKIFNEVFQSQSRFTIVRGDKRCVSRE